jgi:hypothetical protein
VRASLDTAAEMGSPAGVLDRHAEAALRGTDVLCRQHMPSDVQRARASHRFLVSLAVGSFPQVVGPARMSRRIWVRAMTWRQRLS